MSSTPIGRAPRFRHRARVGAVASLAVAACFGGCDSQPFMPEGKIRLEVFVSRTELVVPQDTLVVRVVATNTSRWPLSLWPWQCDDFFQLRSETQELVALPSRACLGNGQPILHPPGVPVEYVRVWTGRVASDGVSGATAFVPPGEYQLKGLLRNGDFSLASPPVTIRVRAAE